MILALVGPGDAEDPMTGFAPDICSPASVSPWSGSAATACPPRGRCARWGPRSSRGTTRQRPRAAQAAGLHGGASRSMAAFDFDALVLSPGIPHTPAAAASARRGGARSRACRSCPTPNCCSAPCARAGSRARFAGITGTNGKSTTTALLAHILAQAGRPGRRGRQSRHAALALPLLPDDGVYVLEMSSYMLERLATLRFDAAAMLNLSADHLDRHGDMAGYASAKRAIFDRQDARRPRGDRRRRRAVARRWRTWLGAPRDRAVSRLARRPMSLPTDGVLRDAGGPICDLREAAALPGAHNAQNAAAAAAMAIALGVPRAAIARAASPAYPGLPHRQQRVGERRRRDCSSTTARRPTPTPPRARWAATTALIWIAGGMAKEGGIDPLAPFFPRIARALLIGRDAPMLAATLAAHGVPHAIAGTLEARRARRLRRRARRGAPVVLLSPACASFDQFTGFDARGDRFARAGRTARCRGRPPDAGTLARRHLDAGPLVVDRGSLDAGRDRRADRLRLHHDAGRQPGGRRAHRHRRATCSSSSRCCSSRCAGADRRGVSPAVAARRPARWRSSGCLRRAAC